MEKEAPSLFRTPSRKTQNTIDTFRQKQELLLFSPPSSKVEKPSPFEVTQLFGSLDINKSPPEVLFSLLERAVKYDQDEVWLLIGKVRGKSKKKIYFAGMPNIDKNKEELSSKKEGDFYKVEIQEKLSTSESLVWKSQPGKVTLHSNYNRDIGMSLSKGSNLPQIPLKLLRIHVFSSDRVRTFFYGEKTAIDGRLPRLSMPNKGDMVVLPRIWNPDLKKFKLGWELRNVERAIVGRLEGDSMIEDGSVSYFYKLTEEEKKPGNLGRNPLVLSPLVRHLKLKPGEYILPVYENKYLWRYLEEMVIIIEGFPIDYRQKEEEEVEIVSLIEQVTKSVKTGEEFFEEPEEGFPKKEIERKTIPIPTKFQPEKFVQVVSTTHGGSWSDFKENIPP